MTATCRASLAGGLALAIAVTGCGAGIGAPSPNTSTPAFVWLRPAPAPSGWTVARLPSGATMSYPPGWRSLRGDAGTATAGLLGPHGRYLGYLNLTPRQSYETLANWAAFRVHHNANEDDRAVTVEASARDLTFRGGRRGACLRDSYTTTIDVRYIEIACLVAGPRASTVIVGAAPPDRWPQTGPAIERAISAFTT